MGGYNTEALVDEEFSMILSSNLLLLQTLYK